MNFEYQLTEQDFVDAFRAHWCRSLTWRIMRPVGLVLLVGLVVLSIFVARGRSYDQAFQAILPLAILIVFWAVLLLSPVWQVKRLFRKNPDSHRPTKVEMDDESIRTRSADSESTMRWTKFVSFVESEKSFLLYPSAMGFNILPKRVLTSEQIEQLRTLIARHVSAK